MVTIWTRILGIAVALCTMLCTADARAQRDPAAAEALFQQGKAALDRGDLDVACGKLRESHRLDPAVGTLFNVADCEERRGKTGTAWALFIEVRDKMQPVLHRLIRKRSLSGQFARGPVGR
jgi:hypothetical protein